MIGVLSLLLLMVAVIAAAEEYQARLLTPVTSYSQPGTRFEARIVGALSRGGSVLPPGSIVSGKVVSAKPIGFGLRRERAVLQLSFETCRLPSGDAVDCTVELMNVDNARETVDRSGRITGILAASHPHSWLGGIWIHPRLAVSPRTAAGLTGAAGKLQAAVAPTPIGMAVVIASRLLLFRMPNPEIELPPGTGVILYIGAETSPGEPSAAVPAASMELAGLPAAISGSGGRSVADIVNVAFFGSREQVVQAFEAAGWTTADALTPKTFAKVYAAVAGMRAYPTAPVSNLYYEGRLPDLVFQKTFNSVAKRHHIRLWRTDSGWLGAATHDVSAGFEWNRLTINHVIDPMIDRERQFVVNDLTDAGCVEHVAFVERPALVSENSSSGVAVTDGALAVASMRHCAARGVAADQVVPRRSAATTRVARRLVLEGRNYITRSNPYYWAYRGVKRTFAPRRGRLYVAQQQQNQYDHKDQTDAATGRVTPAPAVGPAGDGGN